MDGFSKVSYSLLLQKNNTIAGHLQHLLPLSTVALFSDFSRGVWRSFCSEMKMICNKFFRGFPSPPEIRSQQKIQMFIKFKKWYLILIMLKKWLPLAILIWLLSWFLSIISMFKPAFFRFSSRSRLSALHCNIYKTIKVQWLIVIKL